MKTFFSVLVTLTLLASCDSMCIEGEGPVATETRDPGTFTSIRLQVPATLTLEQTLTPYYEIEAQPNILALISDHVHDGTLKIKMEECITRSKEIKIRIGVPEISNISIDGSGNVQSKGLINARQIGLAINGSGDIRMETNAESFYAGINGSGGIKVKGAAQRLQLKINGSGDFDGADLASVDAKVQIRGSGNASVYAIQDLDCRITGSGNIYYKGNPRVKTTVSGSGSVDKQE